MAQAKQETTALRRVLSRSLTVLGGTIATTAAAWAISTATAAADEFPGIQDDLRSVVASAPVLDVPDMPAAERDLVSGLGQIVKPVEPALGDQAANTVEHVGTRLTGQITPSAPVKQVAELVEVDIPDLTPTRADSDRSTEQTAQRLPVEAPAVETAPVVAAPVEAPAVEQVVTGAKQRADSDNGSGRGSPAAPEKSPTPSGPSPLAPHSTPGPANPGHTGSGADAPHSGLLSSVPSGAHLTSARALRTAQVFVPATVDAQPGVTPD
ncbi:hypothetical protein [Actinokineospora iranica]|uniref:Uncharacterized protein n=1 Tax=Actinokineospora iranica TaxID=1271860 RepID=A0A1G6PLH8_9PSEU|nr:hypothetical protein [Actinokineospora iranica]SDC81070.1 hypothetical protein SAMN05216174_104366 [Actinokineospora iranica]